MGATFREELLLFFNKHLFSVLGGITFGNWLKLLKENGFAVEPRFWARAALITAASIHNSLQGGWENWSYGRRVQSVRVEPPLFILGHWRSGTTFLHNLLASDEQFAYPNLYQVFYPHTFLSTEASASRAMRRFIPSHRFQDNVPLTISVPQEDEYALCVSSLCSQYLSWVFPRRQEHYERYLTFHDVPPEEVSKWKEAFVTFAKKLTWKYGRPLLLKSPTHTCRIKLLLEIFPDARFVHIHRNPYRVFVSSRHSYELASPPYYLQLPDRSRWDELIISRYQVMYEAFFKERELIPSGRLHELSYEDLRQDPLRQIRQIYERLALPGYAAAEPRLRGYLSRQRDYRVNDYPSLARQLRERLALAWARCFGEWGYNSESAVTKVSPAPFHSWCGPGFG